MNPLLAFHVSAFQRSKHRLPIGEGSNFVGKTNGANWA